MNKKNKILILTGIFKADKIGGPATLLDPLIRDLIKNDFQISVLTFGKKSNAIYPYPVIKVSPKWPYFIKALIYLFKGLWLSLKADILYNQDLYTSGIISLVIKKITKKPLITRFVGESAWETAIARGWTKDDIITFQEKKYNWKIEIRKKIRTKILKNSDIVVVVSYFLKDLAQKIGVSEKKVKVIYNSIDFLEEKASLPGREELKNKFGLKGKVILTNARLTLWKGVDMLIEIMPKLIDKHNQLNLVIIGEGDERDNLEKLSQRLGLGNNVFFVGKLGRQEIIDYLGAADVFVLNTFYEGMSFVLLEAMKTGVPIITTKAGGNPETIKNNQTGLLVDYRNKEQWLEAISLILDNPDLAQKFANQANEDLKRFSWHNLVQETMNVFRNISNN